MEAEMFYDKIQTQIHYHKDLLKCLISNGLDLESATVVDCGRGLSVLYALEKTADWIMREKEMEGRCRKK